MSYIFVDESGDLGFDFKKKGTPKYFLISFLFVPSLKKRRISKIVSPEREECLQAVDFVSWSIYRKYKDGDYSYYNAIKNKIFEESWMYGE